MTCTIFRRPQENDRETLLSWILADDEHREKGLTPDFFFSPGAMQMVIGDLHGPGLFVRIDSEPPDSVRLHIQFSTDQVRSAKSMLRAWPTFKARIAGTGLVHRIVFESASKSLIGFCCRAFGFRRVGETNDYELMIEA